MGEVIRIKKFKKPESNRDNFKQSSGSHKRVQFSIPMYKFEQLHDKANKECKTPYAVQDVLALLVDYYTHNEFVVNRRMICVDDPTSDIIVRRKRDEKYRRLHGAEPRIVNVFIPKEEHTPFSRKTKDDGITINNIMGILVDFYLDNRFIIKTKIIRTNLYRTDNEKNERFFNNLREQIKSLDNEEEG